MSFKSWLLSLFTNYSICGYNVYNETIYFYSFGTIKRLKLDNLLSKDIKFVEDKEMYRFILKGVLIDINIKLKEYDI